jgi:hypothetical protein
MPDAQEWPGRSCGSAQRGRLTGGRAGGRDLSRFQFATVAIDNRPRLAARV